MILKKENLGFGTRIEDPARSRPTSRALSRRRRLLDGGVFDERLQPLQDVPRHAFQGHVQRINVWTSNNDDGNALIPSLTELVYTQRQRFTKRDTYRDLRMPDGT